MGVGRWRIRVDVGGTFTDCVALDPDDRVRTAKVLSSGAIRGVVARVEDDGFVLGGEGWALRLPALVGARASIDGGSAWEVIAIEADRSLIRCDGGAGATRGSRVELTTGEPAPILAARLVTGTPAGSTLPACDFRLATTRATNALLERRFARAALIVSEGFADVLRIGDQRRPDVFALHVVKPPPITELTFGVPGRLGPDGSVVVELDEDVARDALSRARSAGAETVAIALINSWADPRQELRCEAIARELGFGVVIRSSDVAPRIGLLHRSQAAAVEAALGPVLGAYLDRVAGPLPGSAITVLGSAGGLTRADRFRPIDSLLSGPAGGVIGAASAGRASGFDRVISFDMGGTSTDVARIEGGADLASTHTVGGITIARPAVAIETVAAGGGSICHVEGGRPAVGPQSAGAEPGPACYGGGGPLTITDVNLLLGRIDSASFEIPIDIDASQRAADALAAELARSGDAVPREELLAGLLDLASERMAEAIRSVSIRKGYDPADHALVAFGGAGPQHACDVAARLGMTIVLVPREASLLSAVGLHAATPEVALERELMVPLRGNEGAVDRAIAELSERAREELREQSADGSADRADVGWSARLRLVGQESSLIVEADDVDGLGAAFAGAYERVHGSPPEREVEVVGVRVLARARAEADLPAWTAQQAGATVTTRRMHDGCGWIEAAVHERDGLAPGATVEGPAMIAERRTQTWVPPAWRCEVDETGALRLGMAEHQGRGGGAGSAASARSEVLARELIVHRLASIAEQMGDALEHAAVSVNVKDRRDYSCGVLDALGRLVSSAAHLPVHLGALGPCVRSVIERLGPLGPGDAALTNHPGFGGSHLPDLTVIQPVFDGDGERIGYVASRAHHAEIGGLTPGSMPPSAKCLADEGVPIAPVLIARAGRFMEGEVRALLLGHRLPTRAVEDNASDLIAAVVAGRRAGELIAELVQRDGREAVVGAMSWINGHAAALVRERIARDGRDGPDGGDSRAMGLPASAVEVMDDGTEIRVALSRVADARGERLVVDFTGSSPAHPGNINAPLAVTRSAVAYVVRLLLDQPLPLNDGFLEPMDVIVPEGTFLNPVFPDDDELAPPVAGGNVETSQRITEALLRALRLCAGGAGTMNNVLIGNDRFGVYETICSGAGASRQGPGADAVHQHMTNTRITDAEVLEQRYPLRVRRFEIRAGSGGDGKHRGGCGAVREIEALEPVTVTVLTQRRSAGAPGLDGGGAGAPGRQRVVSGGMHRQLAWADSVILAPGDVLVVETPGGGGFGER